VLVIEAHQVSKLMHDQSSLLQAIFSEIDHLSLVFVRSGSF
jgi:hypothetical protein